MKRMIPHHPNPIHAAVVVSVPCSESDSFLMAAITKKLIRRQRKTSVSAAGTVQIVLLTTAIASADGTTDMGISMAVSAAATAVRQVSADGIEQNQKGSITIK